ncbi:class I glutamine amidotransferase-like protein [Globomyces pollinis-pini]|nr:class I glutamine amidotransferase-like protein [Globomyces pollinis-pini]
MIIAGLIFEGWELQDLQSPLSILAKAASKSSKDVEVCIVGETKDPKETTAHLPVIPKYSFTDCPQIDVLLIPGGAGTFIEVFNPKILDFIKRQSMKTTFIASICTGSSLLAKVGLLDDKKATTNKMLFQQQCQYGPKTDWVWNARWVQEGNIITASGVSAGTDMGFDLARKVFDNQIVDELEKDLCYSPLSSSDDPYSELHSRHMTFFQSLYWKFLETFASYVFPTIINAAGSSRSLIFKKSKSFSVVLNNSFDSLDVAGVLESMQSLVDVYQTKLISMSDELVVSGGDSNGSINDIISVKCDIRLKNSNFCEDSQYIFFPSISPQQFNLIDASTLKDLLESLNAREDVKVLMCGDVWIKKITSFLGWNAEFNSQGWANQKQWFIAKCGLSSISASLAIIHESEGEKYVKTVATTMELDTRLLPNGIKLSKIVQSVPVPVGEGAAIAQTVLGVAGGIASASGEAAGDGGIGKSVGEILGGVSGAVGAKGDIAGTAGQVVNITKGIIDLVKAAKARKAAKKAAKEAALNAKETEVNNAGVSPIANQQKIAVGEIAVEDTENENQVAGNENQMVENGNEVVENENEATEN